jgi:RNA polymerase sporulation-specific sigma factor
LRVFLKPLTQAEEQQYLQRLKQGDEEARQILIERNLRLVSHIIKKYALPDKEMDDLISIGTIGLIKAVDTFDPEKASKLGTYAARCIENELLMMLRSDKKRAKDVSLYEPIGTDKEGNAICLVDIIEGENCDVVEQCDMNEKIHWVKQALYQCLNKREQEILIGRYGLQGCKAKTQKELAEIMGISRSYVSRIEKKALEKLKTNYEKSNKVLDKQRINI